MVYYTYENIERCDRMELKPMKILMIEDDIDDCIKFKQCLKTRNDIELVDITDSDIKALKIIKEKRPEGIILDLELNDSNFGSLNTLEFMKNMKNLHLNYEPIVIVTTHINSRRTYDKLHKDGVELISYKCQPNFSYDHVLNNFISLRKIPDENSKQSVEDELKQKEKSISDKIYDELELIGISPKMVGREYLHEAILYLIEHPDNGENLTQYLTKKYKRASNTISNGMQNAINQAWRFSAIEDLEKNYTAKIDVNKGVPTPLDFVYYYRDKINKLI